MEWWVWLFSWKTHVGIKAQTALISYCLKPFQCLLQSMLHVHLVSEVVYLHYAHITFVLYLIYSFLSDYIAETHSLFLNVLPSCSSNLFAVPIKEAVNILQSTHAVKNNGLLEDQMLLGFQH